jgi:hypothetical protein
MALDDRNDLNVPDGSSENYSWQSDGFDEKRDVLHGAVDGF